MRIEVDNGILFYAFRYALGRMTYAVGTVVGELKQNWEHFDISTQMLIKDEIKQAILDSKAGMDMDVRQWQEILEL